MKQKFLYPLLVIVAALLGAATLMATTSVIEPTIPEPIPTSVNVINVKTQSLRLTVNSQGTIAPRTETELVPEVSGRITWMSPALVTGGHFKEGERLLLIDNRDYQSTLDRANATIKRSEAELEHARFEYQRLQQLEQRQLASRSQSENALRAQRVAEAAHDDAEAIQRQAARDLTRTELKAPFDGRVRTERVDVGQFIARGTSIASLYASDYFEIRLPVADRQLAYLNIPAGYQASADDATTTEVNLSAEFGGQNLTWFGHVVRTEAEIDMKSRMVNVIARVRGDEQTDPLSVGLFVKAVIAGREVENVVVLPRSALRNGNQVLIVDADNRLFHRTIEPLRLFEDQVIIRHGLNDGDRVCISQLQTVIDGMKVNPLG